MSDIKRKAVTGAVIALLSLALGSIGFMLSGCKTSGSYNPTIHVIENDIVVTNSVPMKQFNDEHYVWESFYFSTNQVKGTKK